MLVEKEVHKNCTVIIMQDDKTGKIDISWYDNTKPPILLMEASDDNRG